MCTGWWIVSDCTRVTEVVNTQLFSLVVHLPSDPVTDVVHVRDVAVGEDQHSTTSASTDLWYTFQH